MARIGKSLSVICTKVGLFQALTVLALFLGISRTALPGSFGTRQHPFHFESPPIRILLRQGGVTALPPASASLSETEARSDAGRSCPITVPVRTAARIPTATIVRMVAIDDTETNDYRILCFVKVTEKSR